MKSILQKLTSIILFLAITTTNIAIANISVLAQADVYIKDTPSDTGVEPNPDTGPMWITEDIWVRSNPDPNYQPYPFPESAPPWIPLPHENPEYRDPKFTKPNYVYIKIRNRGNAASSGNERLKLYWAKASTGLSWNSQWVDYLANNCGPTKLFGGEITKPRKNAATATQAERDAYRDAIVAIGTEPAFEFPDMSYWHKQQQVHRFGPTNRHGTPAFLPWHREMINRYEVILQEKFPTVKLLYWDWTTDPENSSGVNLFTTSFMGASGRGTGGITLGNPFGGLTPPNVTRQLSTSTTPPASADSTILANTTYPNVAAYTFGSTGIERSPNHNSTHGYIGGTGGDMSFVGISTQDPFFFLLHTNVDRLWSQWQRNGAFISRLDTAITYGTDTTNGNITTTMAPWDGTGTSIRPWTVGDGYIISKTPTDPSVVSPPIYDTAPLTVPALQPGEAVIVQVPWYPPNPADFSCFGGDQGHFCLLTRIETSTTSPFGMNTLETTNVSSNTRNNNNIAWKNITVVDNFSGAMRVASVILRNTFKKKVVASLRFNEDGGYKDSFFDYGKIKIGVKPDLLKRIKTGNPKNKGIKISENKENKTEIQVVSSDALLDGIELEPGEMHSIDVQFELNRDYKANRGANPVWDIVQLGSPDDPNEIVGGQRYQIDLSKITLVKRGSDWRYTQKLDLDGLKWATKDFDDSRWTNGKAEFAKGNIKFSTNTEFSKEKELGTVYFRHQFEIADKEIIKKPLLRLKVDDGAVVYLNGKEIHRSNLPQGKLKQETFAEKDITGLRQNIFSNIELNEKYLVNGKNIIAVAVHQTKDGANDMTFDLELISNNVFDKFEPDVLLNTPKLGLLQQFGQPIQLNAEALDSDGKISSVSFYENGKLLGTSNTPPYSFIWKGASLGLHRVKAVATDSDKIQSSSEISLTVLKNTPPSVKILDPTNEKSYMPGDTVSVSAEALDPGGKVKQVEYYLRKMEKFTDPDVLVGTSKTFPYKATFKIEKSGHYMITAHVIDNLGTRSLSIPVHIMSGDHH